MAKKVTSYIFLMGWLDRIIIGSFWWAVVMAFVLWVPFLRVWWWVVFPLLLSMEVRRLYLWYMNWDYNYKKRTWVMLEITPPGEMVMPFKSMEDVFSVMWGPLYAPGNWREVWFDGELAEGNGWMSWEVASIEGKLHFYLRVLAANRSSVEKVLYSHYPQLEIREVSDYTQDVPQNIPNKEWDTYGEDFILTKPAPLPIKTFEEFFEPQGEKIQAEEKRLDPIASLLEMMADLGPGEQFWLQFTTMSTSDAEDPEAKQQALEIIAKYTKRSIKKEVTLWQELMAVLGNIALGPIKEGSGEKATLRWRDPGKSEEKAQNVQLTDGERKIISAVETKMSKPLFRTSIRGVYVAKRDNWRTSNKILTRSYFTHFQTQNLNTIKFAGQTRPKSQYFFRKRIPFIRSRRMFRNYILRFPPLFPNRKSLMPLLNPEELATLFHMPIRITGVVLPTMSRIESKKGGPPPNLPTE